MPLGRLADFYASYQAQTLDQPVAETESVRAAVLCPLYIEDASLKMLFIKRSQTVRNHKGEISFPGGVKDPQDSSLMTTSIRETDEEIGVIEQDITIFGTLDEVNTSTGFLVSPFVGTIPYPYEFKLSLDEVDSLIGLAVNDFLEPDNEIDFFYFNGRQLTPQRAFKIDGHTIWGATAKIMGQFLDLGKRFDLFPKPNPQTFHLAS
ncbi:MAG: coenzyme A pyrophosphatase [Deltaproteobacteria bacterium]|nr:MAG: coenzyme A pyrophosphatase [Deltaproteobacteria bacterium]